MAYVCKRTAVLLAAPSAALILASAGTIGLTVMVLF